MVDQINGMGQMAGVRHHFNSQPLTDAQKTSIQDILSKYDSANVTKADAQSIFQAFKDAGIRPSRELKQVIEAAGFDAEALRDMGRPDRPADRSTAADKGSKNNVDLSALKSLQNLLGQFDLSNMTTDNSQTLVTKLQELGFLTPGSVIDLKS
ncbi:MAG: hypothetical protein WCP19_12645 [Chloroflexota bacterium]